MRERRGTCSTKHELLAALLAAAEVGLPVNPEWRWGEDQRLACTPLESWPVPAGESVAGFKARLLRER